MWLFIHAGIRAHPLPSNDGLLNSYNLHGTICQVTKLPGTHLSWRWCLLVTTCVGFLYSNFCVNMQDRTAYLNWNISLFQIWFKCISYLELLVLLDKRQFFNCLQQCIGYITHCKSVFRHMLTQTIHSSALWHMHGWIFTGQTTLFKMSQQDLSNSFGKLNIDVIKKSGQMHHCRCHCISLHLSVLKQSCQSLYW